MFLLIKVLLVWCIVSPSFDDFDNKLQEENDNLQSQLQTLQSEFHTQTETLKTKQEEAASFEETLAATKKGLQDAQIRIKLLEQDLDSAKSSGTIRVTSEHVQGEIEESRTEVLRLETEKAELRDKFQTAEEEKLQFQQELDRERALRDTDSKELARAQSELAALQHELHAIQDQATVRTSSDASHYKERAKLQAELGAAKRAASSLEDEKVDLEAQLEDLILDKEQLIEEKEILQDKVEELKIDAETAQMEVEELRMELEDASGGEPLTRDGASSNADDVAQALTTQNARLREALIRLREQTSIEKVDHTRQLSTARRSTLSNKRRTNC